MTQNTEGPTGGTPRLYLLWDTLR
uniref:Uncharacterized protein n=1 Tax=Anguilla anguilla TaxID=7936 RepID=A0A0E9VN09_ANGAN